MSAFQNSLSMGNLGVACMLLFLSWTYSWPEMRADVLKFVASCDSCQRVKSDTRAPAQNLKPLPIPNQPCTGIDFIVKLPLYNTYDSIRGIVNHYTKGAHFSLVRKA